ncbi:MAG: sulfite exporter TauE/SafE family protein [Clostridia bacterium]|nr:sulfite exporter TauE/SafE family protein [Clostridia bacterium]
MKAKSLVTLSFFGFLAGLCNGLLGAGGGIPVVFGLLMTEERRLAPRDVYANALCVMLPLSAISCLRYAFAGNLSLSDALPFLVPAIIGGTVGAILLGRLKNEILGKLFGVLVVWSGILLILR